MPHSVEGYIGRAHECVRLANVTDDELIRGELLRLPQAYLHVAKRLREQGFESPSGQAGS
jgi:hypothetical protein